jgi:type III secretion protein C
MKWLRGCLAGVAVLGVTLGASGAIAPQDAPAFFLNTRGAKLADVLRDLGANYRVPVIVSPQIGESFIGRLDGGTPEQTLEHLAQLYQLAWYYDGQTIHVYKAQEVGSQLLTPAYLPVQTLMTQLQSTGILDKRYCRVRSVPSSNALEVQGVPACMERVSRLAEGLDQQKFNRERNQEAIELFALKYAAAADTQYTYRNQQVVVPGVVSVLKDMAQGRTLPLKENQGEPSADDRSLPMFSADPRQNAVLVRDRKLNLSLYTDLIARLDHKPSLVEISVAIIDVNSQDLGALGVDWSGAARIGGVGVSLNTGEGFDSGNFSTVIANTGNFMIRLNALEQNAKARILSRPSVVTLNPRVIGEGSRQEVMLSLIIQDGRQTDPISQREPLPQTLNSEISTHALLKAGQALLLGGFVQDEESESVRKIPLLGDIPFIGRFFRSTQKINRQTVRLFLIKADPWHQP